MLELLVAGSLVAGLVLASVRGQERHRRVRVASARRHVVDLVDLSALDGLADGWGGTSDLPCPWCLAPTREDDTRCASCGQRFG